MLLRKSMKYLTSMLVLLGLTLSVQVLTAVEPAQGTETFIMLKNDTEEYMWLSNVRDSSGKPIMAETKLVDPHAVKVNGDGEKVIFPLGSKGKADINIGGKDRKVLHTWKDISFDPNGRTQLSDYQIQGKNSKIQGWIQVSENRVYSPTDPKKEQFHNYTVELQTVTW